MGIPYWAWVIALSLGFVLAERLWPWRPQPLRRPGLGLDLIYLVFNGYLLSFVLAPFSDRLAPLVDRLVVPVLGKDHVAAWPWWAQLLVAFFVMDFIRWGVHVQMHRVPWLWRIHRVHHSIVDMDWIGNMRFHWGEVVVYKVAQYVPLLLLGFDWPVLFALDVFSMAMGHFNHSNLRVSLGPLRYLLNHPTMHIWHHDRQWHRSYGQNFGINLSLWDWLFGTAYVPADVEQPRELGFPGLARFPRGFWAQLWRPLGRD